MTLHPSFFALVLLAATLLCAQSASPKVKRVYLSQGEWLGSSLSDSGRKIIADVASELAPGMVTQIDINGMADLAPNPARQKRISDERVDAARAEFERLGVTGADIGVQPVATSDGSVPLPEGDLLAKKVVIVAHY